MGRNKKAAIKKMAFMISFVYLCKIIGISVFFEIKL